VILIEVSSGSITSIRTNFLSCTICWLLILLCELVGNINHSLTALNLVRVPPEKRHIRCVSLHDFEVAGSRHESWHVDRGVEDAIFLRKKQTLAILTVVALELDMFLVLVRLKERAD